MSKLFPIQRLIVNLEGGLDKYEGMAYLPKEAAYQELKEMSGQDFGDDSDAWRNWYERVKPDGDDVSLKPRRTKHT